jgi:hypothetical protein
VDMAGGCPLLGPKDGLYNVTNGCCAVIIGERAGNSDHHCPSLLPVFIVHACWPEPKRRAIDGQLTRWDNRKGGTEILDGSEDNGGQFRRFLMSRMQEEIA